MQIRDIGYNGVHNGDFVFRSESIKRDGFDEHLILLLRTPAKCCINGMEIMCPANSVMIFSPDADYQYRAVGEKYINDWIFIHFSEEDLEFLASLHIFIHEALPVTNMAELSGIVHTLAYEHFSSGLYQEEIELTYLKLFFYTMAKGVISVKEVKKTINPKKLRLCNSALTMLRSDIMRNPGKKRNIDETAAALGISRSGLQHSYKKMFGTSIKEDLISARTEKAKGLLAKSNLTVKEVAYACGYSNEYHFIRQFENRTGKRPSEYRKCHTKYN